MKLILESEIVAIVQIQDVEKFCLKKTEERECKFSVDCT